MKKLIFISIIILVSPIWGRRGTAQKPELSEKYKGMAQYPVSFGFGQDFPVVIVK